MGIRPCPSGLNLGSFQPSGVPTPCCRQAAARVLTPADFAFQQGIEGLEKVQDPEERWDNYRCRLQGMLRLRLGPGGQEFLRDASGSHGPDPGLTIGLEAVMRTPRAQEVWRDTGRELPTSPMESPRGHGGTWDHEQMSGLGQGAG